jgi:high-affinity iron transporter
MLESFLITSRETLEAALVVGIVLAYLNKTNNKQYKQSVYYGIIAAIIGSIITAVAFTHFAGGFEGKAEEIFEGITMLVGAVLLTTMILWMMKQRHITKELEGKVAKHLTKTKPLFSHAGIFLLVFVAILREGVETVIFLNAAKYAGSVSLLGGVLGIITAIIIGALFFFSVRRINLKYLFRISSVLLIFFAAGLVAHSIHEFEEAGVVNGIITPLYDMNHVIHDDSMLGELLSGLFGYNANPSLLEVIGYVAYLVGMGVAYWRIEQQPIKA